MRWRAVPHIDGQRIVQQRGMPVRLRCWEPGVFWVVQQLLWRRRARGAPQHRKPGTARWQGLPREGCVSCVQRPTVRRRLRAHTVRRLESLHANLRRWAASALPLAGHEPAVWRQALRRAARDTHVRHAPVPHSEPDGGADRGPYSGADASADARSHCSSYILADAVANRRPDVGADDRTDCRADAGAHVVPDAVADCHAYAVADARVRRRHLSRRDSVRAVHCGAVQRYGELGNMRPVHTGEILRRVLGQVLLLRTGPLPPRARGNGVPALREGHCR